MNLPLRERIQALLPELVEIRRHLHQHPELSFQEKETGDLVARYLAQLGFEVRRYARTGVVGLLRGKKPGPVLAFRADMDALPIQEDTNLPYCSQNPGVMHACGHDGHTTILLGTAKTLAHFKEHVSGVVKLIFQPAEEAGNGAQKMVQQGVLQNPQPHFIFGLHNWPELPRGHIGIRSGPMMASVDTLRMALYGRGGHGSMPHLAKDPIIAGAHIVTALQSIVSRQISPLTPVVISITQFHAGTASNVIPDKAFLEGTVRCLDPQLRQELPHKIEHICWGIARSFGCDLELNYEFLVPVTSNDPSAVEKVLQSAEKVVGRECIHQDLAPSMAGEDFSEFQLRVPGALFWLGAGLETSLHSPRYDFPDEILPVGVEIFSRIVLES